MELQVTIYSKKYKPISTIVEMPMKDYVAKNTLPYKRKAITRICLKRGWSSADLKKYGYNEVKTRVYDVKKIEEEKAKRYAEIKREKFASGEWKPSKKDIEKGLTE